MRASTRWSLRNVRRVGRVAVDGVPKVNHVSKDSNMSTAKSESRSIAAAQQRAAALLQGAKQRRRQQQTSESSTCEMPDVRTAALEAVASLGRSACLLSTVAQEQQQQLHIQQDRLTQQAYTRPLSSPLRVCLTHAHRNITGSAEGEEEQVIDSTFIETIGEHAMGAGQRGGLAPMAVEGMASGVEYDSYDNMSEETNAHDNSTCNGDATRWHNDDEEGISDAASALRAAEQLWQGCSGPEKMRWVRSTAQGRQAWSLLRRALALKPDTTSETDTSDTALMNEDVKGEIARKCKQSKSETSSVAAFPVMPHTTPMMVVAAPSTVGQRLLQRKVAAAEARQQRSLWRSQLRNMLSAEGSAVFVSDIKDLQRPQPTSAQQQQQDKSGEEEKDKDVEGEGSDALGVSGGRGPSGYFCNELGITRSPRRIYVMQRLLPRLQDKLHAPLSLAAVRELAQQFSDEYDAVLRAHATHSATTTTATPQRALIAEEVDRVQNKLADFQRDLPLLKRLVHRMSK